LRMRTILYYVYDNAKKAVDLKEMLDVKEFLEFFGEKRINF